MDDRLDRLLAQPILSPPEDFAYRIAQAAAALRPAAPPPRLKELLQWLALLVGGIPAAVQLATLIFGLWTASVAG